MENDNLTNFPLFDDCISKIKDVSGNGNISVSRELKQAISMHLDELAKSLNGYFWLCDYQQTQPRMKTYSFRTGGPRRPGFCIGGCS